VLIFRGAIIRAGEEVTRDLQQSKAILLGRESERLRERWISDALRASLSETEQASLVEWAVKYWEVPRSSFQNAIATWGKDWAGDSEPPPLLVCLYFLLRDQLNSASNLGQHLLARLESLLSDSKQDGGQREQGHQAMSLRRRLWQKQ